MKSIDSTVKEYLTTAADEKREGELDEAVTCKDFLQVQTKGLRHPEKLQSWVGRVGFTAVVKGLQRVKKRGNEQPQKSELILYQAEDGKTRLEVRFEGETVWLSQKQLGELFQKDVRTINEHIKNVFEERELEADSVIRKFRITALDGKSYETLHYNLDVVISVGYFFVARSLSSHSASAAANKNSQSETE